MMHWTLFSLILVFGLSASEAAVAAETGKKAAMKYFTKDAKRQISSTSRVSSNVGGSDRILAVAVGSLINGKSYQWSGEELSGWSAEIFYQRANSGYFGQGFHLDLQKFATGQDELSKVAFLFSMTLPRRLSFPVYLGVAAGPGFFLQQQEGESEFSFDYRAYAGLRLSQEHSQYFLQSGVKNHLHVLSDGQFIGWFISSGVAYKF